MTTRTFSPAADALLARLIDAAARQANPAQLARLHRMIGAALVMARAN